jgi:hypothetical protein
MFKRIKEFLDLQIQLLLKQLEIAVKTSNEIDTRKQWDLETGKKFNDLISKYPISEDELLSISETVCEFVAITRIIDIKKYLFTDYESKIPRRINR